MNSLHLPGPLVETEWLKENLGHPQLVVLDASSHMPGSPRDGQQEWQQERIPGARFFDFNHKICDTHSSLPHMLPTADCFSQEVQALGINRDSVIVIYDSLGIFSSPRAWWMFKTMGHSQCAILNGGLPAWKSSLGKIEHGIPAEPTSPGNFIAKLQPNHVKNSEQILAAMHSPNITILDARSAERFYAQVDEPRPELLRGHIPNSKSLPFSELLDGEKFKDRDRLRTIFSENINVGHSIYTTCGSGVTACIIAFAAELVGYKDIAVYDGSWAEWGQPEKQFPIATTADE